MQHSNCRKKLLLGLAMAGLAVSWSPTGLAAPPSGAKNTKHLLVVGALANFDDEAVYIVGQGFDSGHSLSVGLGAVGDISSSCSANLGLTPQVITCDFSLNGMPADGDYLLTVATGGGASQYDEYDLTIGAVGPAGPQGLQGDRGLQGDSGPQGDPGPQGNPGLQGDPGPQGDPGLQGDPGPQGERGLQGMQGPQGNQGQQGIQGLQGIQGPQGQRGPQGSEGPPGFSGYEVIRQNVQHNFGALSNFVQTATCPSGKVVLSGGFGHNAWTNNFQLLAVFSGPSPNSSTFNTSETSWTVAWKNYDNSAHDLNVTVWIVCVDQEGGLQS